MVFNSVKKVKTLIVKNPNGITLTDIQVQTGISYSQLYEILKALEKKPTGIKTVKRYGVTFYLPKEI